MSPHRRTSLSTLLGLALLSAPAAAQQLTLLPDTWPQDVSPAGDFVVGARFTAPGGTAPVAVRWSGSPFLTVLDGATTASGCSASGGLIAGQVPLAGGGFQTGRWFVIGGWATLPTVPGGPGTGDLSAPHISADGTVVVSSTFAPAPGGGLQERAYRWSGATGSVALPALAGQHGSRASAVSADGQVTCGSLWDAQGWHAVVWRADGSLFFPLGDPNAPSTRDGFATALDSDGDTVVGGFLDSYDAWVWRADWGLIELAKPDDWATGLAGLVAEAVADDGALVGGGTSSQTQGPAWIWTPADGLQQVEQLAEDLGLGSWPDGLLDPDPFERVTGVSADGSRLVGLGEVPGTFSSKGGWVLDIPAPPAAPLGQWTNLGGGLSGVFDPTPLLTGAGVLTPGSQATLTLQLQPAFSVISLVIGLSRLDAPFKGGVLVPNADLVLSSLNIGQTTPITTSAPWPAGVPSGFETYWQYWMTNGGGPAGLNASNALRATAP